MLRPLRLLPGDRCLRTFHSAPSVASPMLSRARTQHPDQAAFRAVRGVGCSRAGPRPSAGLWWCFVGQVGLGSSVEPGVVFRAEEPAVLDVGGSAAAPGDLVMDVTHRGWPIAAGFGAALVPDADRGPLGLGMEPAGAAEVEDLGGAAE